MSAVSWPTVGVCWAVTTATTAVLFVITKVVSRKLRKRRKTPTGSHGWSTDSEKPENGKTVVVPLIGRNSPSRPNCPSGADRRKQDDVSRWCSDHGLPENLVYTLREQGFETKAALDALRPEDLQGNPPALQLPSHAVMVQLRQVLMRLHSVQQHDAANRNEIKSVRSQNPGEVSQSLSDGGVASEAQSPSNSSDVFLPVMASIDEVDIDSSRGEDRNRRKSPRSPLHETSPGINCQPRFHGILSDKGLWEVTNKLGHEWRHLATFLDISKQRLEQLTESHPHQVRNAIHEMLTIWRNEATGSKEQIKATLHKALIEVERNDIAKLLMDEQTHGSIKKIKNISSII